MAADKGYHAKETIANLDEHTTYRPYIPEPERPHQRVWTDKPPEQQRAMGNTTGVARAALTASDCRDYATSASSAASHTFVKPAARDERGSSASTRCVNAI